MKISPWRTLSIGALISLTVLSPALAVDDGSSKNDSYNASIAERNSQTSEINSDSPVTHAQAGLGSSGPGFNCETSPWNAQSTNRVWNAQAGLYQDGNTRLNSNNILAIGDSQLWGASASNEGSWVYRGIKQAGYNPVLYRCGGIGVTAWRPGYSGSYYGGITNNEWDLPIGSPRAIYIQGSGNDTYSVADREVAVRSLRPLVDKLHQLYPGIQIILTGPIGTANGQVNRYDLNEKLSRAASDLGLTFISYEKWISDYEVENHLQKDGLHFQDQYQGDLAPYAANSIRAALSGMTLRGGIQTYISNNRGSARFGVPTSNETGSVDGGVWQSFSKNSTAYWSPFSDAHSVWFGGAIGADFKSHDYERGSGYPTEDESTYAYGARQVFEKANGEQTRFYWASNTGSHRMNGRGAIFSKWVAAGHANTLGFPVTDEIATGNGGVVQYFRNRYGAESAIYWSPTTGAHIMNSKGAIYSHYMRTGGNTKYGFPITDEYTDATGNAHVKFSKGYDIWWSPKTGLHVN